jgi:hypothetical protein
MDQRARLRDDAGRAVGSAVTTATAATVRDGHDLLLEIDEQEQPAAGATRETCH